jgi:hypothetical protein
LHRNIGGQSWAALWNFRCHQQTKISKAQAGRVASPVQRQLHRELINACIITTTVAAVVGAEWLCLASAQYVKVWQTTSTGGMF